MGHFAIDKGLSLVTRGQANKEEMGNAEEENPNLLEREIAFPSIRKR